VEVVVAEPTPCGQGGVVALFLGVMEVMVLMVRLLLNLESFLEVVVVENLVL
jgi:hypothetical protein